MPTVGLVGLEQMLQVLCRSKGLVGLVEVRRPVTCRTQQQVVHRATNSHRLSCGAASIIKSF